jgi:hypothetical protein
MIGPLGFVNDVINQSITTLLGFATHIIIWRMLFKLLSSQRSKMQGSRYRQNVL